MRILLISLVISSMGFMSCSSKKTLEEQPPFTVDRPAVQYWSGGREESGSGMEFQARWNPKDPGQIRLDSLFFRGHTLKLEAQESETGFVMVASRSSSGIEKPDYTMHADSTREVGNQPPLPLSEPRSFPFDLNPDEAVISYFLNGEKKKFYTKISGIREKQSKNYPGRQ